MSTSITVLSTYDTYDGSLGDDESSGAGRATAAATRRHVDASPYVTVALTIYIFRGRPIDVNTARHTLLYFTSPDLADFHHTVHVQRDSNTDPWVIEHRDTAVDWMLSATYVHHVNAGAFVVPRGKELAPVTVVADVPVGAADDANGWNDQSFVLDGLRALVDTGFEELDWYDCVEGKVMDKLLDGAV